MLRILLAPGRPATRWVVVADTLLAVGLALFAVWISGLEEVLGPTVVRWDPGALTPAVLAAIVAAHLPLCWRQRYPLAVLCVVLPATVASSVLLGEGLGGWAPLVTLSAVASWSSLRRSLVVLGAVVAFDLVHDLVRRFPGAGADPAAFAREVLVSAGVLGTAWAVGAGFRWRRLRGEQRSLRREEARRQRAQQVVIAERDRMARELHDILAHSLSVMVLQASGGREVLPFDPARARAALEQIEATGRQSLVEVRRLLGLMEDGAARAGGTHGPGLARLDELVGQVADAGVAVRVVVEGAPRALPPSVDLAAYRIVQEALTNVLKHAGPATATIRLDYQRFLTLEVIDDGHAPPDGTATGGRGLLGMGERAQLVGGTCEAGRLPGSEGGGFRVAAVLPLAAGDLVSPETAR